MGQFEIKGEKTIELVPDIIHIDVMAEKTEYGVKDNDEAIENIKSKLKESVVKLVDELEKVTDKCKVSFSDLTYNKLYNTSPFTKPETKTFGKKKEEKLINLIASTKIQLKIDTRDEEILSKLLCLMLESIAIKNIYSSVETSNIKEKYNDLLADVCKDCKEKADKIVENLGSEILGVDKIVYNSLGRLMDKQQKVETSSYNASNFGFGAPSFANSVMKNASFDIELDECDLDECENIFGNAEKVKQEQLERYNKTWAKGFVTSILDKKSKLYDEITVVFRIK